MIVPNKPEDIEERIRNCELNLKIVRTGDYTPDEKKWLKEIYINQLAKYKQKRMSFLKVPN